MEAGQCPSTDEWIKELWDIYTMVFYSAVEKKENLPFATVRMDSENIMLSERCERQISYDFTHM